MMVMLHGLRGRMLFPLRVLFLPAPLLEAGAGKGNSPASFRALWRARMDQDGHDAPV
jgi:hypothetical protein